NDRCRNDLPIKRQGNGNCAIGIQARGMTWHWLEVYWFFDNIQRGYAGSAATVQDLDRIHAKWHCIGFRAISYQHIRKGSMWRRMIVGCIKACRKICKGYSVRWCV